MFSHEPFPTALPLWQRLVILALAISAHAVLLSQVRFSTPDFASQFSREMSVSIVRIHASRLITAAQTAPSLLQTTERTQAEPVNAESQPAIQQSDQVQAVGMSAPVVSDNEQQPVASSLPDREPDYRATYLNNPQPSYPLVARRMGWQGRVVLDVEVLANGSSGEVTVQQGSGRDILDQAALGAVRGWRFVPARSGGISVARHFLVPIAFNLK